MEITPGVERRHHWRDKEKLRILAKLDEPGAKFNAVARRHDASRGLPRRWRDASRAPDGGPDDRIEIVPADC